MTPIDDRVVALEGLFTQSYTALYSLFHHCSPFSYGEVSFSNPKVLAAS